MGGASIVIKGCRAVSLYTLGQQVFSKATNSNFQFFVNYCVSYIYYIWILEIVQRYLAHQRMQPGISKLEIES